MTRFARRYSAPSLGLAPAGPTQAFLSGQPAYCVRGLSNWLRQLSNPGRGFSSPRRVPHAKKSPYLRTGSHLEYGGEGGIDSLRSPLRVSPLAGSQSVQLAAPVVEPRSGVLIPPAENIKEKACTCVQALISNMAVRGGLTRFARPCGVARSQARSLSNWLRQLSNPGRGFSSPPAENIKKKACTCVQALISNMAVRGGFEPPIRCRIHTFQACSFSHSDTSPYCLAAHLGWATGRYYRELR